MTWLFRFALERPRRTLLLWILLLLALAPGLAKLRLRTDGRALVPPDSREARDDASIRAEFGVLDPLVVVVESSDPQGIFQPATLQHVIDLSRALAALPLVRAGDVVSLATEPGDHVRPGTLELVPWLERVPADAREMGLLQSGLARARIYRGTLLSCDTPPSATAILIGVRDGVEREELQRVVRAAADSAPVAGDRVYVVGAPAAESQLGEHLLRDLATLIPAVFGVMGALLYLGFRRWTIVLLTLLGVGACLLATLALLGATGAPIYLTCILLPVILTVVGVADWIHVYDEYVHRRSLAPAEGPRPAAQRALESLWRAVVGTSATTATGFLSFALSPIPAVRVFGLAAAAGVVLCMLWSLSALPACLVLFEPARAPGRDARERIAFRARAAPLFASGARAILRRPGVVLGSALVACALAAWGATRVEIQDSWVEGFAEESELRRATARVDSLFGGTHILRIRVESDALHASGSLARTDFDGASVRIPRRLTEHPRALLDHRLTVRPARTGGAVDGEALQRPLVFSIGGAEPAGDGTRLLLSNPDLPSVAARDMLPHGVEAFDYELDARERLLQPSMLAELRDFSAFLARSQSGGVGAVLGPYEHLETLFAVLGTPDDQAQKLLASRNGIGHAVELYVSGRGERRLGEVLSPDRDRALVTVLLKRARFTSVAELLRELRAYERERLAPLGIRLVLGGDIALSQAMIAGIVRTQLLSFVGSLAGIAAITVFFARSLAVGLCLAVPCTLAVLLTMGTMGWLGIPLGVATSMFAAMTIGIGVDYAIHLGERLKRAQETDGREALAAALADVGPAIFVDALSVGAGFSVLLLSRAPPNARLALLLVVSIAGCLVASLTVLPVLLGARLARARGSDRRS